MLYCSTAANRCLSGSAPAEPSGLGRGLLVAPGRGRMAPSPSLGSASPVGAGGEDLATMTAKVKADWESWCAACRGAASNADWYVAAVESSVSFTAQQQAGSEGRGYTGRDDPCGLPGPGGKKNTGVPWFRRGSCSIRSDPDRHRGFEPGFRLRLHDLAAVHPQWPYLLLLAAGRVFFELTTRERSSRMYWGPVPDPGLLACPSAHQRPRGVASSDSGWCSSGWRSNSPDTACSVARHGRAGSPVRSPLRAGKVLPGLPLPR
jgi:hypothetical protein